MYLTKITSLKLLLMPCAVFVVVSATLILWFISLAFPVIAANKAPPITPTRCLMSVFLPCLIAYYGFRKQSLNFSGTQIGFIIGFIMSICSYSFMISLLVFFMSGSKVTNWKSSIKAKVEENFKEGGQRNWLQVICNGGVAAELALLYCFDSGSKELPINFSRYYTSSWLTCGIVGALASSCGDTFASELGVAFGTDNPRLITNLKKVPRGTNGAISMVGILASLLGGFLIGLSFFVANALMLDSDMIDSSPPQWPIIFLGSYAGLVGSLIDSLLGATLQFSGINKRTGMISESPGKEVLHISGITFLDNHNVNLLSSLLASIITSFTAYKVFGHY